jgi:hypothetical protein
MIRKLKSGGYRLYSRKANPKTGRRRNLGTFKGSAWQLVRVFSNTFLRFCLPSRN